MFWTGGMTLTVQDAEPVAPSSSVKVAFTVWVPEDEKVCVNVCETSPVSAKDPEFPTPRPFTVQA